MRHTFCSTRLINATHRHGPTLHLYVSHCLTMDNYSSSGNIPLSEDVVMSNNDLDNFEDMPQEESHRRRSASYARDDERNYSSATNLDRSGSRDRRDSLDQRRSPSRSRSRDRFREDKYDTERRQDRSSGPRNRSRSPVRGNGSAGAGSLRDRRIYVGNLSYDVKWTDLKDFMREIGAVAHADVLLGSDGRSKGCGVVEFQRAEHAQEAIRKLNDVVLMGRPIFVREDRETEGRIGFSGGRGSGVGSKREADSIGRQVYVSNLPFSVNWKDLKDLFRRAGPVARADVFQTSDMRSKGSGTVIFERASDLPRAINMFNRYEWFGRRIEVREVGILLMDLHCSSYLCICFREGLDDGFDLRNRRLLVWRYCTSGLFSGACPAG
ncbi:unnamed protein product [Mortierella alpina]